MMRPLWDVSVPSLTANVLALMAVNALALAKCSASIVSPCRADGLPDL
jgi:hypothetical protein